VGVIFLFDIALIVFSIWPSSLYEKRLGAAILRKFLYDSFIHKFAAVV
jgi:hypothetical protein